MLQISFMDGLAQFFFRLSSEMEIGGLKIQNSQPNVPKLDM
jgi:hypothetical protein